MATRFIEETDVEKIAKALIVNHDALWVVLCGEYKELIRDCILARVRALGIESESQLYGDIDYSICTKESINDRCVHWSHDILICNIEGLISETINHTCTNTCIRNIRSVV